MFDLILMKLSFINCNHENALLHEKNNLFYETSNIDYISKYNRECDSHNVVSLISW